MEQRAWSGIKRDMLTMPSCACPLAVASCVASHARALIPHTTPLPTCREISVSRVRRLGLRIHAQLCVPSDSFVISHALHTHADHSLLTHAHLFSGVVLSRGLVNPNTMPRGHVECCCIKRLDCVLRYLQPGVLRTRELEFVSTLPHWEI